MLYYPRTPLASSLADALQGKDVFSDAPNGLFLAAPRRTGKSTFLQADLMPELQRRQVVVVYVDLWADQKRDPGSLIAEAVGQALLKQLGVVAKTAKLAGLDSISVGGIKIDTSKIGKVDGSTLTDALRALSEASKAPVALVIDEAQHALTSEAGETAMAALKSARDQLNRPGEVRLMLVMSGSDRDKLLRLVNTNAAPFYGSQIHRMPELGADFIAHIAQLIVRQRADLAPVNEATLSEAFTRFGQRPQFFMEALGQVLSPLATNTGRFEDAMLDKALQKQDADESQMESDFTALRPLEQAVLWRMLELGQRFRPYDADALQFYNEKTGEKVTVAKAQKALEGLRAHQPSLIWKSARSEYAVEDAAMLRWYTQRAAAGSWPPASPQLDWVDE
ncbi:AAA family ATPase [Rhodoferax sp. TBRC 17660]|uniref:AAA family ATPase n=1 Tax=Rhodoferax potami TaxID=3068338 RepID=A0ABU3KNY2_9BURK|nr:AAA family ATPase [Rhodoferax sp. TBRC 17660]MDT7518957.1 AAA family ATPase [Rhodoferax sp. TBRC 17660]